MMFEFHSKTRIPPGPRIADPPCCAVALFGKLFASASISLAEDDVTTDINFPTLVTFVTVRIRTSENRNGGNRGRARARYGRGNQLVLSCRRH